MLTMWSTSLTTPPKGDVLRNVPRERSYLYSERCYHHNPLSAFQTSHDNYTWKHRYLTLSVMEVRMTDTHTPSDSIAFSNEVQGAGESLTQLSRGGVGCIVKTTTAVTGVKVYTHPPPCTLTHTVVQPLNLDKILIQCGEVPMSVATHRGS